MRGEKRNGDARFPRSAVKRVLGRGARPVTLRDRLANERRAIILRLAGQGTETHERSADQYDQATDSQELDITVAEVDRLSARAEALALAIERVDAGTYGICVSCGERIGAKRLEAIPEADQCITCRRLDELAAALRRPRRSLDADE